MGFVVEIYSSRTEDFSADLNYNKKLLCGGLLEEVGAFIGTQLLELFA